MAFYDMFTQSTMTPKDYWRQQLQEDINRTFENAATYELDIEEEDEMGSMTFHPIECRLTTLVDSKTGQRNNDDYKQIIFKNIDEKICLGWRYRFEDNIWIVFSTGQLKTETSSVYIRRCNNVLVSEDKYGNIHEEPCYIDYKVNETQLFKEYTLDVPQERLTVTAQRNKYTKDIDINRRFIFNKQTYKVRALIEYDRTKTFDAESVNLMSFHVGIDNRNPADRFDIAVADYFEPAYRVETEDTITNIIGYNTTIQPKVTFVNEKVDDEPVYFESTNLDVCTVNQYNGTCNFVGVGQCQIYCRMFHNPNIYSVTNIEVVSALPDKIITVIEPDISYIKLNQPQTYTVYAYKNNVKLDTKFDIKAYDVPENFFTLTAEDNSFTVNYFRYYEDGILRVVCTNVDNGESTTMLLDLGGVW